MRQFARLTLSAPIPEDTTIMNFRHPLEKYQLAAGILETINNYLQDKGLSLRHGTIVEAIIIHHPLLSQEQLDDKRQVPRNYDQACIYKAHNTHSHK